MIALSDLTFGVTIGSDVILLDARADRYHALVGAVAERAPVRSDGEVDQGLVPEAATALIEAGLATSGSGHGFTAIHGPDRALSPAEDVHRRSSLSDFIDLAAAVATAWWRLRRGLPCRSCHADRLPTGRSATGDVRDALSALRRLRLFIPTPRRCLPASLITAVFLVRRGVAVQIVFGVRSYPFEAHCWVEHDGVIVDDDLAKVSAFRPIMVGRP
jgi:hypothetical protein